jgi:4-hydroxybenzoate polyprenyltransferase
MEASRTNPKEKSLNHTDAAANSGLSRFKLFLALSRTPHALLDLATPALGAMLWLGRIPPPQIVILGFLTAFAGYTAVYALNDLVDYRLDWEKIQKCGLPCSDHDLDAVYVRHPLAQGMLSLKEGILWTAAWAVIALLGALLLNPVCALVFLLGCLAEAVYCLMFRVSYLRILVSGVVKTAGGIAAVFAVEPNPSVGFLLVLFLWLICWEIGGQNVPNDLADLDQDRDLQARTLPVHFGANDASRIVLYSLAAAIGFSIVLFWVTPAGLGLLYLPGALIAGSFMLLLPARRLAESQAAPQASALFNRASYYPLAMLIIVLISTMV